MTVLIPTPPTSQAGKSLLQIMQLIYGRLGLGSIQVVIGNQDQQAQMLLALLTEEGQELAARTNWTALQTEATFLTVALEDQGFIDTIAPGMRFIVNDTIWNRTLRRPLYGPRTEQQWQQQKAFSLNGPWSGFRIKNGHLYMFPVPVANQTCAFEFITSNWVADSTWTYCYDTFQTDTDTPRIDYQLLVLGTIWRWKSVKGLEYAEDFNKYERRVMDAMGRDGGKDNLNLNGSKYDIQPVAMVPSGSWSL